MSTVLCLVHHKTVTHYMKMDKASCTYNTISVLCKGVELALADLGKYIIGRYRKLLPMRRVQETCKREHNRGMYFVKI